jgi:sugar phosphate isomerase/epimerase
MLELTRIIDEAADKRGLKIAIEPVNSGECNIINTFEQAGIFAHTINGKTVKAMADYFHMRWDNEKDDSLLSYREWLIHTHIACPYIPGKGERGWPKMDDGWDYSDFLLPLKEIGYNQRISVEAYTNDIYMDMKKTLKWFKAKFQN